MSNLSATQAFGSSTTFYFYNSPPDGTNLFNVIINPTIPVILFGMNWYAPSGITLSCTPGSIYSAQLVVIGLIGNNIFTLPPNPVENSPTMLVTYHTPFLFFENSVLILPDFSPVCDTCYNASGFYGCLSTIFVYNMNTETFTWTENIFQVTKVFGGWDDAFIDYKHQYLYLLAVGYNSFTYLLFAIPFSELPILLNNLQLPQNTLIASIMPPNGQNLLPNYATPPNYWDLYPIQPTMIYYNDTFYFIFMDSNMNVDIWVVPLSDIQFSTTMPTPTTITIDGTTYNNVPSNLQTVGTVTVILNTQGNGGYFNANINYYINNGSIIPEILIAVMWYYSTPGVSILSVNPDTLSVTNIAFLNPPGFQPYMFGPVYISGGLLIMSVEINYNSWYILVYDRNTGESALFPPPPDVFFVAPAEGGYIIVITAPEIINGSLASTITVTVYQVVSDSAPVITNVQFNQNNTITGTAVNLVSDTPASGIVVALFQLETQGGYNFSGEIVTTTTTDSNGDFSFQVSQPGYYAIRAFT